MKLWLLSPRNDLPRVINPWYSSYDVAEKFVVRAESEEQARLIADSNAGDEKDSLPTAWLNPNFTVCKELTAEGEADMIVRDFTAG